MTDVGFLIVYENESTTLDFKREQYVKEKYQNFVKDIMSMANAPVDGNKYIIVGVKERPDGSREFHSVEDFVDQATYEQIIKENVEPAINFTYKPFVMDEYKFGVFEIQKGEDPPYMMKKDYKELKKGDSFIRRGSQQDRLTRRDLDELLLMKSKKAFNGKILVGFNKKYDVNTTITALRKLPLPSIKAEEKIKSILKSRENETPQTPKLLNEMYKKYAFGTYFEPIPYEERSVKELEEDLKNINKDYKDEDDYYVSESLSKKINLNIRNNGNEYLEDASIELKIKKGTVYVFSHIPIKPSILMNPHALADTTNMYYPSVVKEKDYYIVKQDIGDLKHLQDEEAFGVPLRVFFGEKLIGEKLIWTYKIHAKNLTVPLTGELFVEVV